MSQRLFSFLWVIVWVAIVAGVAGANGAFVSLAGTFEEVLLKVLVPIFGTFLMLRSWFSVIDAKILDGSLQPGDNVTLLTLAPFWVTTLGAVAAAFELFGLQFLSENTQTILIDGFVLIAQTLLESLAGRPAGSEATTAARVQAQAITQAASAPPRNTT